MLIGNYFSKNENQNYGPCCLAIFSPGIVFVQQMWRSSFVYMNCMTGGSQSKGVKRSN